jgi:fructose-bisphosphate aldolase class II
MTGAVRRLLNVDRSEFDPRKFLKQATAAAQDICRARFEAFGSAGQAGRIKPLPLDKMADRYRRRPLAQKSA